jgi:tRNA acetyltransferase TAN1
VRLLVTTRTGNEYLAASLLEDRFPEIEDTDARPTGLKGLVVLELAEDLDADRVDEVSEVEKTIPIERELEAPDAHEIAEVAGEVAEAIPDGTRFAVRCTRRGSHEFSSQDVERLAGAAVLDRDEGHEVDLTDPDHVLRVEIINDWTGIGVVAGEDIHKKYVGKPDSRRLTKKTTIVQRMYESKHPRGTNRVGASLGRSAQAFQVDRLVVGMEQPAGAEDLDRFVDALQDGIGSRHEVQKGAEDHPPNPVPVEVADLHQMARRAQGSGGLVVATDPRGVRLPEVRQELGDELQAADEIFVFNGSNEALPTGLFSQTDYVLDLAPSITYGTDQAIAAVLVALVNAWNPPEG